MRPALVLVVLLAAPAVAAAEAVPVEGDLRFPDGAHIRGDLLARATRALLDLSALAQANGTLLAWDGAEGYLVEKSRIESHTPLGSPSVRPDDERNETIRLGPGSLGGLACHPRCVVVLFADGRPASFLGLAGAADEPLAWLETPRAFGAGFPEEGTPESFYLEAAAGWAALAAGAPRLGPQVGLFLWNASGEIRAEEGARAFRTGVERRPLEGPLGSVAEESVSRHLVLHLDAPRLAIDAAGATLWAQEPEVRIEGELRAPRAEGDLQAGDRVVPLGGRSLHVEGALELRPRGAFASLPGVDARDPLGGGTLAARVQGEATEVLVDGASVAPQRISRETAATGALLLLALLGAAWYLKSALLSPFYTRVDPARALSNPNRARLHRLVCETPGLTAADLVRLTGAARVVVDHHLRMLVACGHLVSRGARYRIAYFPAAGAPDEGAHARVETLRDPTRWRVARHVLEAPGASQRELAARAELRQRLVSHHLRRLEEAGLVAAEGSMPRRYRPAPALEEALQGAAVRVPVLHEPEGRAAPTGGARET